MFNTIKTQMIRLWNDESGAAALEYGLIAAGIAVVIVAGVGTFGTALNTFFTGLAAAAGI